MWTTNRQVKLTISCLLIIVVLSSFHFLGRHYEAQLQQNELTFELREVVTGKVKDCFNIFLQSKELQKANFEFQKCLQGNHIVEISEKTQASKISSKTPQSTVRRSCIRPKTNIAFLKTHKTASSTITNILQRFGCRRNLTFVMPFKSVNQQRYNYIGGSGETITHNNIIPKRADEEYNILCNHVVYNESAFQEILPSDTFLFTIIREPFHQFISTLNYYGSAGYGYISEFLSRNVSNPLSEYLQSPWKYEPEYPHYSMTNNKMSIDLGMPTEQIRNADLITSYIKMLKSRFQLVLLQDYFDESLILLKRYTCLTLKDIMYISHNIWPLHRSFNLSADDIHKHRKWNAADYALYDTFYQEFWEKVLKEKDFFSELNHFRKHRQKVYWHCLNEKQSSKLTIFKSKWSEEFTLTPGDCFYIRISETKFNELIHQKMMDHAFPYRNFSFTEMTKHQHTTKSVKSLSRH